MKQKISIDADTQQFIFNCLLIIKNNIKEIIAHTIFWKD